LTNTLRHADVVLPVRGTEGVKEVVLDVLNCSWVPHGTTD
jgi:hypothetical protein